MSAAKHACLAVFCAVLAACGGGGGSIPGHDAAPEEEGIKAVGGFIGLSSPWEVPATLVVGSLPGGVDGENHCGDLRYDVEYSVASLDEFPHAFETPLLPAGDHVLVAVLVNDASSGVAYAGSQAITITAGGGIELGGVPTDTVDVTITGSINYVCP